MKMFKNAVAVVVVASGLYSVAAIAGPSHTEWDFDAGTQDVKWRLVQPGSVDFTVTTSNLVSIDDQTGQVNGTAGIGTWKNNAGAVTFMVGSYVPIDKRAAFIAADWSQSDEVMEVTMRDSAGNVVCAFDGINECLLPAHSSGTFSGLIRYDRKSGGYLPDIAMVVNTRFSADVRITHFFE